MKTKLKQFSKRTISVLLSLVMLVSMAVVGIVTVHAYDFEDNSYIYFEASKTGWTYDHMFVAMLRGANARYVWKMSRINGTDIWYVKTSGLSSKWTDGSNICFFNGTNDAWAGVRNDVGYADIKKYATNWSNTYGENMYKNNAYFYRATSSGANNNNITKDDSKSSTNNPPQLFWSECSSIWRQSQKITVMTDGDLSGTYSYADDGTSNGGTASVQAKHMNSDGDTLSDYGYGGDDKGRAADANNAITATATYKTAVRTSEVIVSATPKATFEFVDFYNHTTNSVLATAEDITPVSGTYSYTYKATDNWEIYARFKKSETLYDVTPAVSPAGAGTIEPDEAQKAGDITTAEFTARPNPGYTFSGWTIPATVVSLVECTAADQKITLNALDNATVTANFTEKAKQTVTVTAPTNGSITVAGSSVSGNESVTVNSGATEDVTFDAHVGDVLTVTATPDAGDTNYGYKLTSLTAGGEALLSGDTYTILEGINPTVTATFEQTYSYRIKVFAGSNGTTTFTAQDSSPITIPENQAQNFEVAWAKGYTVSWALKEGFDFNGVTKNGTAIAGATAPGSATGTHADAGAVYKTSFSTSWPPVTTSAATTSYIWISNNSSFSNSGNNFSHSYDNNNGSTKWRVYKANSNSSLYWITLDSGTLDLLKNSGQNIYVAFSTTSNQNDIATDADTAYNDSFKFAIAGKGTQQYNFGNDSDQEKFARFQLDTSDYSNIKEMGILVDNTTSTKPVYTIYSSGEASGTDSNYDPFYIGGRFSAASDYAGDYEGDFKILSEKLKFTKHANDVYTFDTGKTIAELSATLANSAGTESNPQLFLIHDKVSKYVDANADFMGNNFQNFKGEANAITLSPVASPDLPHELCFDDPDNTSNGKVKLWIDASNYAEGNSASQIKVWYTLVEETPAVAENLTFSVSPSMVTVGDSATLTATISGVHNTITNVVPVIEEGVVTTNSELKFTFQELVSGNWTDLVVVDEKDIKDLGSGKYRVSTTVAKPDAGSYTFRVKVEKSDSYHGGAQLREIYKSGTGKWNPQTVYYTNDITASAASPEWTDVNATTKFASIEAIVASGGKYTIALSDEGAYNPDFKDFTIATEYNQYCDITMGNKTVTIDNEDRVIRTYIVTPRTNCVNPIIYIDSDTNKIYAVATYNGASTTKTSTEAKTVTYYFAERVADKDGNAVDDYKKSSPSASSHDGVKIQYWNNSSGTAGSAVNVTTPANVSGNNIIYVSTADLYRQNPTVLGAASNGTTNVYNQFKVYSVALPVWATSFRFLKTDGTSFNAVPTYTADDYNINHSITLNPNRIYLLYQNKETVDLTKEEDWTVKGVVLDQSLWSSTRTLPGNEVVTKGFTANLINYKDISDYENSKTGVNLGLDTWYKDANYGTPNALYFGYLSSIQSWEKFTTDKQWAQNNAQRKNDDGRAYYAAVQDLVGSTLTTVGTSIGSKGTYNETTALNANGFGMLLDTRTADDKGVKNANLMPLFDYPALTTDAAKASANQEVAQFVAQGLNFPFYVSTYHGITTYSYDSTTDRNRVYDDATSNFKIQTTTDNESHGVIGMETGKDSNDKGYAGFFPFGGNTNKYSNTGFGTEFDLNFYMTNSGYLTDENGNAQDIAFNFSGDDDVWVFVDGVKVLDLGGDHKVSAATINFSEGKVYYKSAANSIANVTGVSDDWSMQDSYIKTVDLVKLMASYGVNFSKNDASTKHTFQMFYMERGAFQSNCVISFNLPQASGLNVRNNVTTDRVNPGLKDAALASSNGDSFTFQVANAAATNEAITTLQATDGYTYVKLPGVTGDWAAVASPLYPLFYNVTRVYGGETFELAQESANYPDSAPEQIGGTLISSLGDSFTTLNNTVYKLTDKYAYSEDDKAEVTGITANEPNVGSGIQAGDFHLLGGQMANFTDKVRPNSYVRVMQRQNLGKTKQNTAGLDDYSYVADNNAGNYYVTSYDIYDEATKKDIVKKSATPTPKYGDSDSIYANDSNVTGAENGFYFSNYSNDSTNINPAMTVNFYNDIAVGSVRVAKEISNSTSVTDNFYFKVEFAQIFGDTENAENWQEYDVSYKIYNIEDDTPVSSATYSYGTVGIIIKPGQYAEITGVPVETRYRVTEVARPGYSLANIDKTAVKPNGDGIDYEVKHLDTGFYNYPNQGTDSLTAKDKETPEGEVSEGTDKYYCNMIPVVSETHVTGTNDYISISTVKYTNKKENFTVIFKYYDRYEIDGQPAGINSTASTYSVPIQDLISENSKYKDCIEYVDNLPEKGVKKIDFAKLIAKCAVAFEEDALIDNVVCDYHLWTSQSAAETEMAKLQYFNEGEKTSYQEGERPYHTNYVGKPNTSGEKWVNYYDTKGTELSECTNESKPSDYLNVRSIVVWCYNYPKQYSMDIYGANSFDDLVSAPKTVNDQVVYVANAISSDNTVKRHVSAENGFYYNQRLGSPTGIGHQDEEGFISNFGIPGVYGSAETRVLPENYAAESFTNASDTYTFAYWAFDPAGTQIASVDRSYMYRITTNTKLYAVYTKSASYIGTPGISLSANENDTYVDDKGVSRTRLNIQASVFNAIPFDPLIQKIAFVNISLSSQIRQHPETYTPDKINAMFEEYKDELLTLISQQENNKDNNANFSQGVETAFSGSADYMILTLTPKGFIYTVTSNGNTAEAGEATAQLTNKNRVQFTMSYKTSALIQPEHSTCLMYTGALKYNGTWSISTNCLIYKNGAVVDNSALSWT